MHLDSQWSTVFGTTSLVHCLGQGYRAEVWKLRQYSLFVYVTPWFQGVLGINTASDISKLGELGEVWNIKSGIYAKYPKETLLLFVYNMWLRNYSSEMRGESFCCIWSHSLHKCLPLKNSFLVLSFSCFCFQHFLGVFNSSSISNNLCTILFENKKTTALVTMEMKYLQPLILSNHLGNFLACIII